MKKLFLSLVAVSFLSACASAPATAKVTLEAGAMKYQPVSLEVTIGQSVELTFNNTDAVDHDFTIMEIPTEHMTASNEPVAGHDMGHLASEPELHMAVAMGKSGILSFTPTKSGTYEFFCTVAGHKEAGMVGTLVVKAP